MDEALIVIPARYGSQRFPGKPLVPIAGVPMLLRVYRQAEKALALAGRTRNGRVVVATDDERIADAARAYGIDCVMTPADCPTGSDRCRAAVRALGATPSVVLNWQGDNPCSPTRFAAALIAEFARDPSLAVATPCIRLRWRELDQLRENKKTTPFSGTFAVLRSVRTEEGGDATLPVTARPLARGEALLFSKHEIPALREEKKMRAAAGPEDFSPLYRHIGLYAYRSDALENYALLPRGELELLEGLEQLRFLEHGIGIRALVMDDGGRAPMTGVDSPEDIARAETWLAEAGE